MAVLELTGAHRQAGDAPAHQKAEVLSAIGRLVRSGELGADQGLAAALAAWELRQQTIEADIESLRQVWQLRERVRPLDGLYVGAAVSLRCPLLTTDRRLANADLPCEVLFRHKQT